MLGGFKETLGSNIPVPELPKIEIPEVPIFGPFTDVIMKFMPLIEATVKTMTDLSDSKMDALNMFHAVYNNFKAIPAFSSIKISITSSA